MIFIITKPRLNNNQNVNLDANISIPKLILPLNSLKNDNILFTINEKLVITK